MGDLQGIEKINNYRAWCTLVKAYFQRQYLWEIMGGTETTSLTRTSGVYPKWCRKVERVKYALLLLIR